MELASRMKIRATDYLGRRTLIMGDVNSGKTRLTQAITEAFLRIDDIGKVVVIDMAPETTKGIGGALKLPESRHSLLLRCSVIPPRLTGTTATEIQALAEQNARAVEPLLTEAATPRGKVLVVNDASLYLQAGPLERLTAVMAAYPTVVANAYIGNSFRQAPFTTYEHNQVNALAYWCDHVIRLEKRDIRFE